MTANEPYPKPIVPEHLTKLTIENIEFDTPYFVKPGERDDHEPPTIFTSPSRELKMDKSYAIDPDSAGTLQVPIGLASVMRTVIVDSSTNTLREVFIADLRFIGDNQLVDMDIMTSDLLDQEQFMYMVAQQQNAITFDGFIAPEADWDIDDGTIPGTLYGPVDLHDALTYLQEVGTAIFERFLELEARPNGNDPEAQESDPPVSGKRRRLRLPLFGR